MNLSIFWCGFLLSSCCCMLAVASEKSPITTTTTTTTTITATKDRIENFNCPEDCECVIARNTHKPFLHAKCSSLKGLKSDEPLRATLPIHSMDLSYLGLSRLSHALEKLPDLTSVDLSHNELHEFGHLGRRIKKLNLKHNRITSSKLSKLPQHVQVLNLQHNDITYLPMEMKKLHNLHTLELAHNQINCSCETLEVRNWLQERNVFMEHPVKCSFPREYKEKPWLQVKQEEVCEKERRGWHPDEEENELMMGDAPIEGSATGPEEEEEELGKAFIPVDDKAVTKSREVKEVEGSGDLDGTTASLDLMAFSEQAPDSLRARTHEELASTAAPEHEEEDEEGSGSGGGILMIPHLTSHIAHDDDFEETGAEDKDSKPLEEPVDESAAQVFKKHMTWLTNFVKPKSKEEQDEVTEESQARANDGDGAASDIFNRHMGIFEGAPVEKDKSEDGSPSDITEDNEDGALVPVVHQAEDSADGLGPVVAVSTEGPGEEIKAANVAEMENDKSIYFLFGVLAIVVLGIFLYVFIKRCKANARHAHDAENPRQTELLNMDKKNPGKPLRNGNEHLPLIGEKTKADLAKPINGSGKKPYDSNDTKDGPTQQEPLMNGNSNSNGNAPVEEDIKSQDMPLNEAHPHEYYPISPRYPRPQSPRASKYAQYPPVEPNNNEPDSTYLPSSPKSGRYSPVYSPETGRVKIKLTETPRPKTPMLVTRSKSNAGDIITTPVQPEQVHSPGANGQLVH